MESVFRHGREGLRLHLPDDAVLYAPDYPPPPAEVEGLVVEALQSPVGAEPLRTLLRRRRPARVVVVVSDITRPVPYRAILPALLTEMERAGVGRDHVLLLVATGMHRPSTPEERLEMFGEAAEQCTVIDHAAADDEVLVELPGQTRAGAPVRVNRHYVEADFRIVTGLVEPHFMAGFSGGRKAICPGLVSLETIRHFHGPEFLASPAARNGNLEGNPLHLEALSVARLAGVDFSVNAVLDQRRRTVGIFAGELERTHETACRLVRKSACPRVQREADLLVTSSGGYPLDATFYQCVKGFVSCLPAVREGGIVVAFGGCSEGVGSAEYEQLMARYAGRWRDFLSDIRGPDFFVRDQWELQVHARALEKLGERNLHFVTDGLSGDELGRLSVKGLAAPGGSVGNVVQELIDDLLEDGMTVAAIPEGPYCAPMPGASPQ